MADPTHAKVHYDAAVALRPDRPDAFGCLAEVYAADGKIEPALLNAKTAVRCATDHGDKATYAALLKDLLVIWKDSLDDTVVLSSALEDGLAIDSRAAAADAPPPPPPQPR